ncbi:MAG: DUF2231 domain-containing protein [Actinomycetes bacterium]
MTTASLFDTVRGLPVHVLVNHAAVVLVPLVMLAVVAVAVMPRWRARFVVWAFLASVAVVPLVGVTILSGRELKDRVPATGSTREAIQDHEALGNWVFWFVLAVAIATAVLAVLMRASGSRASGRSGSPLLTNVVAGLVVVLALLSLVQAARAGEAGSSAVWRSTVGSTS